MYLPATFKCDDAAGELMKVVMCRTPAEVRMTAFHMSGKIFYGSQPV